MSFHVPCGLNSSKRERLLSLLERDIVGEDWDFQDEFSAMMNFWDENCFASLPLSMLC